MTPKEKAQELVEKYDETLTYLESKSKAKQCALIAVYEILNANGLHPNDTDYDYNKAELYWEEVNQEINNL
jgi:recombinational DNA repair protein (RecF pathway)